MGAFGRYELLSVLGQGGFATVHRAHDTVLDRDVAIKILHSYLAGDPQISDRFVREGRALARIRHPNLVQVYDAGTIDDQPYLAMEFIDGQSLLALSTGRQMPLDQVSQVVGQVAGAVDAVHAAGLVHRDIKPANIIVENTGRAVLLDLGIARDMDSTGVTATGLVVGTPGFLAPEQVDSSVFVGPRTDVYQLAATCYTLLAGKPPYEGDTAQVLYAVAHKPPPDLGVERPDLPYQVIAAVTQALAKDPTQRPESAVTFAAALSANATDVFPAPAASPAAAETIVAAQAPTVASGRPPAARAPSPVAEPPAAAPGQAASRRRLFIAGGAVLVLLAAIAGAFTLFSGGEGPSAASEDATPTPGSASPTPDDSSDIRPDGKEVTVEFEKDTPLSLAFRAPASNRVSFVVEDGEGGAYYRVRDRRDNAVGTSTWIGQGGGILGQLELPGPGDYRLEITPTDSGSATLVMYEVPGPMDKKVGADGSVQLAIDVPGAIDSASFEAPSGERFSVTVEDASGTFNLVLSREGEGRLASVVVTQGRSFIDVEEIRREGRLVLTANPVGAQTARAKVTVHRLGPVKVQPLTFGETAQFETSLPGENAAYSFQGEAGGRISVRTTKMERGSTIRLFAPGEDRTALKSEWSPSGAGGLLIVDLPVSGEFTILVDPPDANLESGEITVFDITEVPRVVAVIGGAPATVSTTRPGQQGAISFSGAAGQLISVRSKSAHGAFLTLKRPGGELALDRQWLPANATLKDVLLEQAGEYEFTLEPGTFSPLSISLELLPQ